MIIAIGTIIILILLPLLWVAMTFAVILYLVYFEVVVEWLFKLTWIRAALNKLLDKHGLELK